MSVRPSLLALEIALFLPLCVCVFLPESVSLRVSVSLCGSLSLSFPSAWLSLFGSGASVSLPLSSLPPLRFLSTQEEACKGPPFSPHPPPPPPHPIPSPGFFSPPYSRQIKCAQLLPAETGLNCTPVAMAIPDDLRGWNVALPDLPAGASGLQGLTGPRADPMQHPGWAVGHRQWPHPEPPCLSPPPPGAISGSGAITHMLLGRGKAFSSHQPGP